MSTYDTVHIECPECGWIHDIQSHSGPCCLDFFFVYSIPPDVAIDIIQLRPKHCENCGIGFEFEVAITVRIKDEIKKERARKADEKELDEALEKLQGTCDHRWRGLHNDPRSIRSECTRCGKVE
ncbi:MAG: hypothetical protein GY820_17335 [Gammaproteobacteria bacterium]|nr:hypothetical protein [Gammaproteobacteria bacterium]